MWAWMFALSSEMFSCLSLSITCQRLLPQSGCICGTSASWLNIRCPLCHTHAQKTCMRSKSWPKRPMRGQSQSRQSKVMLQAERTPCHLCPTWMCSQSNATRRNPIKLLIWLGTGARAHKHKHARTHTHTHKSQGQLVQPGNAWAAMGIMRKKFAGVCILSLGFCWGSSAFVQTKYLLHCVRSRRNKQHTWRRQKKKRHGTRLQQLKTMEWDFPGFAKSKWMCPSIACCNFWKMALKRHHCSG